MSSLNMGIIGALKLVGVVFLLMCSVFAAGAAGQAGRAMDLGTVLAGEKNLTTFYDLIRVRRYPCVCVEATSPRGRHERVSPRGPV